MWGGGEGEHGRASEGRKHGGGGGEVPLNLDGGVKERGGVQKKRKEVQRESTGLTLCFGCRGIQVGPRRGGRGVQGSRGGVDTSEQSRKLAEERNTEEGKSASLR